MSNIMPKTDIKTMIKDLKKNELRELLSIAQEVLSSLFNSSEIRDNIKESRFTFPVGTNQSNMLAL